MNDPVIDPIGDATAKEDRGIAGEGCRSQGRVKLHIPIRRAIRSTQQKCPVQNQTVPNRQICIRELRQIQIAIHCNPIQDATGSRS